jgi:hypothetical protein
MKENIKQLEDTIEKLHHCEARFIDSVSILESFEGKTVWEGVVNIFQVEGHPQTDKCYAWSSPIEGSKKRRYYTILHMPPVDSPEKAVRAAIINDYQNKKGRG